MVRILIFVFAVWLLFTVFVTVFAASAKKNEVRTLPKWLWLVICIAVPFIGGLLYLLLGRPLGGQRPSFGRGRGRTKVVAPDDDPTFLRDLAEKLDAKEEKAKIESEESEPKKPGINESGNSGAGPATNSEDKDNPDNKPDKKDKS